MKHSPFLVIRCRQPGFSYLGLLLLLALLSAAAALTVELAGTAAQRSQEAELLDIGEEFNRAFEHYYRSSTGGKPAWPAKLDDLVADPRFPGVVRHLRRIYPNPLNGKLEWGIIPAMGGGIMGVFPIADGHPIRRPSHTLPGLPRLTQSKPESAYADWRFGYDPRSPRQP